MTTLPEERLLTLIVPLDLAETVEDLLLACPELVDGFTAIRADGHGSALPLLSAEERVSGHAPRCLIQTVATERSLRMLLDQLKAALPGASLHYWLSPILERGHL